MRPRASVVVRRSSEKVEIAFASSLIVASLVMFGVLLDNWS